MGLGIVDVSNTLKALYLEPLQEFLDPTFSPRYRIWRLPGYLKYRLPDGSTRIVKLHLSAAPSYGNGNRAKRRMGWTAQYRGSECWVWIPPKKKRRRRAA